MRITGLSTMILPRAAAAYGMKPQAASEPAAANRHALVPGASQQARAADSAASLKPEAQTLIAGGVRGAVTFEPPRSAGASTSSAAYQLYTRAADKIEAAVGVQIGRQLDVCG